jgi:DNA polymerase I-like protein with 3'-5' exonuclease and polymerase domains
MADPGFLFAESDLEQAESRDTAYIAGEENLILAVEGENDFHSSNASAFFGIAYELIFDNATRKQLDVALRDLAKRVNHGANYNMGWAVLVQTMGEAKVWQARRLLGLPLFYTLRQIAEHLLAAFHRTYPRIKGLYYPKVLSDVATTRMLVGATGWTRYCFGNPGKNKSDLNALVAHCPQSLNAQTLNKAYLTVFYEIAMNPKYSSHFKLCAQIHDSILFQYRVGHDYLCDMVKERMEIPVTVKGADDVTRTFTVPAAVKKGGTHWHNCK